MRALLIAEKPSLMRLIEEVYKKHKSELSYECDFLTQAGHLLTLKKPDEIDDSYKKWCFEHLPFHPEEHGGWKYKIITGTGPAAKAKDRYKTIGEAVTSGKYDFIIHAGDPDQEGQLLVDIVLRKGLKCKLPIKRYWSNDTTEEKVLDALKNLIDYEVPMQRNLLMAAYGRQHSDYRFGMNLSEAASLKMNTRAAVGRVKTPILAIVCKREDDIKNFVPSTCYGIKALYTEKFNGQLYNPSSKEKEDNDKEDKEDAGYIYFDTKKEAEDLIKRLGKTAIVEEYSKKRAETLAPKLYKLATAQIDAGKFGFDSSKTLEILQSLYQKGYMSYPRTDCEYMSSKENYYSMIKSAMKVPGLEPFIKTIKKETVEKVRHTKKWANDKELESHGHSALVPTTKAPDFSSLTKEEQIIYEMICRRFIAIFLPPIVQEKTFMITNINGEKFRSSGKTLISAGFAEIFGTKFTDMVIPEHKAKDVLSVDDYELVEKTTKCPTHLSDTDLIQICEAPHKYLMDPRYKSLGENLKIGTSATRASIIKGLIVTDKYLKTEKSGKKEYLVPTDTGRAIYENLKFCKICRIDLTGEWEERLEKVRVGALDFVDFEALMKKDVETLIDDIKSAKMTEIGFGKKASYKVIAECPKCGGNLMSGEKGFGCSNWKEKSCKFGLYKKVCDSFITDDEFLKLIAGETIEKKIKKGTTTWMQKLKFDDKEYKLDFVKEEETSEYKCPNCKKPVIDDGRAYKCSCGFSFWKTPGGKTLKKEQLDSFFEKGSTGVIKGLKGQKGKSFNADIILSDDKKGITYKFENKH